MSATLKMYDAMFQKPTNEFGEEVSRCWQSPEGRWSNPMRHPFRVTIIRNDNTPGLHGWSSRSQVFATLDEALAVVAMPMRRGDRYVEVTVAKNRATWNHTNAQGENTKLSGYWEVVGKRKNGGQWAFSKLWNEARVKATREYLEKKGA